ncbi:hypothetical protein WPS_16440 [Vulcanimicrobium alpinum]|uniref:Peptidase A2 domain-containing protein n=1 Tax=Vulcanimicrobium alpinum TaxID=3016050 RepID=A0AAN1XXW4_UNVUL|nr:aspartyl protease family protein [Vulcanimicrobium alpinum]BDE06368.1 hypothetical protein WPS_16440 [Vulcanimicrobium alpinum]
MDYRVFVTAALLAPLMFPSAGAAADEADALLAQHQSYVGWHVGDGVVKTLRETGAITRNGKQRAALTMLRYGIAHRLTTADTRGFTDAQGFTGNVFWTSNTNGFTVRPVGEVARYLYDADAVFGELTATMKPEFLRRESVDGVQTAVLKLTSDVGFPMQVFVDPTSGAYLRVVIDPGGKYEETISAIRYTEAGGKRFISGWRYGTSPTVFAYTSVEPNATIAPDELRPPKQTASWTFGDAPASIELTRDTFPRILIDARINGVKGRFILDTGAAPTVVTDSFARRVGAKRLTQAQISGIGGDAAANVFHFDTIAVGGATVHDIIGYSGCQEEWMAAEGVVGLIGYDLLAGAIVNLDFDAATLHVFDPAKVEPDRSKGFAVRMDLSDGHIRVPMKLNDKYDVIATLDSGNPLNVLVSKDLVSREHVLFFVDPSKFGSTRYGGGVGGMEIEHCGRLQSLTMGPINYRPVPACDSDSEYRNEILVGLDFMKAFNFVFNFPDGEMVMIPRKL